VHLPLLSFMSDSVSNSYSVVAVLLPVVFLELLVFIKILLDFILLLSNCFTVLRHVRSICRSVMRPVLQSHPSMYHSHTVVFSLFVSDKCKKTLLFYNKV